MPLPLFIVIALASLLVGTAIGSNWDAIVVKFKGKKLAVLGARGVGKTHLVKFLATGSIPNDYKQTVAPEKSSSRRFQLKDLDLNVKESVDVSGDKAAYAEWKQLHDQADFVFYLMRADKLIAGDRDVEARASEDLAHIGTWLESRKSRPLFFIIGTHCDLDVEFCSLTDDRIGDYVDRFRRLPIVMDLVAHGGGSQQAKVVLGSMKTVRDTEALVYEIFRQVTA